MTISELIKKLEIIQKEHGDLKIWIRYHEFDAYELARNITIFYDEYDKSENKPIIGVELIE